MRTTRNRRTGTTAVCPANTTAPEASRTAVTTVSPTYAVTGTGSKPPFWTAVVAVAPDATPRTVAVTPVGAVPGSRATYTIVSSPTAPAATAEIVIRGGVSVAESTCGLDTSK